MARSEPFDRLSREYDAWFEQHDSVYQSELAAVRAVVPADARGVEIGVGSGRFASPLGISEGVEPSAEMARLARERGIVVYEGTAEELPLTSGTYDYALMVTTLCFLDDPDRAVDEMFRVIKSDGRIVVGLVDRESPVGRQYEKHKAQDRFYKYATFHSASEVVDLLSHHGLSVVTTVQTVFGPLQGITEPQAVRPGYGEGAFVVIASRSGTAQETG